MVRSWLVHSVPGLTVIVVGVVLAGLGSGTALPAAGFALVGVGAVIVTSVFFYEVGRSEDEARRRESPPPGRES